MKLMRIWLKIKWQVLDICFSLGFRQKLNGRKGEVQVLCFHGVCKDDQAYINARFLKESHCNTLLKDLKKHFNIISLEELIQNDLNPDKLNVLLTFDDGYKNNQDLLLPILHSLDIPATIFVNKKVKLPNWADLLDLLNANSISISSLENEFPILKGNSNATIKNWIISQEKATIQSITASFYKLATPILEKNKIFWETMSIDELKEIDQSNLISLANHGANHQSYLNISSDEMTQDFRECLAFLEDIGSQYSTVFAYPYGKCNSETIKVVRESGATIQFSTKENSIESKDAKGRLVINPFLSTQNQLRAIYNGKYI